MIEKSLSNSKKKGKQKKSFYALPILWNSNFFYEHFCMNSIRIGFRIETKEISIIFFLFANKTTICIIKEALFISLYLKFICWPSNFIHYSSHFSIETNGRMNKNISYTHCQHSRTNFLLHWYSFGNPAMRTNGRDTRKVVNYLYRK